MSRTGHRAYRRKRERLKRSGPLVCWLCGQPINTDLPPSDPYAFHADHVIPVGLGGSNTGQIQPAHRICNQSRGTKDPALIRRDTHSIRHY